LLNPQAAIPNPSLPPALRLLTIKEYRELIRLMHEHSHTIAIMKKPVIASVKGYALANGAGLVFA
jgi:enoyl-CoA hydratase/carnithine racemase